MDQNQRPIQNWDPRRYAENARFVSDLGSAVLELLAPNPGESILDLGCGDGALTEKIAECGARVVGVDSSPDQIKATLARGIEAHVLNGHALNLDEMFDAVFSNAALHWMKEPARVIEGVANALKPCGRFVAEMGGAGNVSKVISGIADVLAARGITNGPKHPWYFPDEKEYGGLLADAGFIVHEIELIPRPTRLPGDVGGWIDTFGEGFFAEVPGADLPVIREEIIERLRPEICDDDGVWWADYVRLRFKAELSAEFLK